MMVDTDVWIWYLRGNDKARHAITALGSFCISAVTYMEIVQGVRNAMELRALKAFMLHCGVECVAIDPKTTDRAIYLLERFSLGHGLRLGAALIAAAADIRGKTLLTGNVAHYKCIPGLSIQTFRA